MRKLLAFVLVLTMVLTLAPAAAQEDLSGTKVTIFGAYTEPAEHDSFIAGLEILEAETGIDIEYQGASDFEVLITARIEGGDPPDIAGFPQPGLMKRFADAAVDLRDVFDMAYLQQQYNQSWIDMATMPDGKIIGVWNRAIVKSLVWYAPEYFDAAGYPIPETWDELIALSDQIVADGHTPWYAPMESGNATGWVGTDWIEDIMLRTTTLENYDNWTVPVALEDRLPFTSPEVKRAWELMGQVLLNEDYVYGGILTTLSDRFFDTGVALLNGDAYLAKQGSYMPGWLLEEYPDLTIGPEGDLNYFFFPPIDEEYGKPVLTGGDVYSMYNDRPEVRKVMEWLTTAQSLEPAIKAGTFMSAHQDVDLDWYDEANRGIAEILLNATSVRFDGSDLQPGAVGTGTFWSGVVDYINGEDLDAILEKIDASWPTE
ncbi:MAG: carbohydrate ABC transporter substrate-binding protein [Anaerolineae bacterium]|nr:carbohydrate ABC transporter substrate-binding protein [Anaerolineae bacterium]